MAAPRSSWLGLPLEIKLLIANSLDRPDLLAIASTCKNCYTAYLPLLHEAISFDNIGNSAESALYCLSRHPDLVKRLEFTGYIRPDTKCQDSKCKKTDEEHAKQKYIQAPLSKAAKDLLRGQGSGQIQELRMHFDRVAKASCFDVQHQPFMEHVKEDGQWPTNEMFEWNFLETEQPTWCTVFNEVFEAPIENETIRTFCITNLPPRKFAAYISQAWAKFWMRLTHLEVRIMNGTDDPEDLDILHDCGEYLTFVNNLDEWLLQYCSELRTLKIGAYQSCPLGFTSLLDREDYVSPLISSSMPKLETLHLQCFLMDLDIVGFILAHKATLTSLTLDKCFVDDSHAEEKWSGIFKALVDGQTNISHFGDRLEYDKDNPFVTSGKTDTYKLRAFPYGGDMDIDDYPGFYITGLEFIDEEWREEDWKWYNEFTKQVAASAAAGKQERDMTASNNTKELRSGTQYRL